MPDLDPSAIAASIGAELFPTNPGESSGEDTAPPEAEGSNPLDGGPGGEVSASLPPADIPLPKAWKKEKEPLWMKLDREAKEYLTAREQDVLKGLDQYSSGHKSWNELISPFQPLLQQHPDVNPVQLMQNLLHNHLALSQGDPTARKELAQKLLQQYGLSLEAQQAAGGEDPRISQLEARLAQAERTSQQFIQGQAKVAEAEQLKIVQAFASDPQHRHFEKVAPDVLRFLASGAAQDLAGAYELACYANPEVRALVIAEQHSADPPQSKPAKLPNLDGSGEGTPRKKTVPKDWRDTVDEVAKAAFLKH